MDRMVPLPVWSLLLVAGVVLGLLVISIHLSLKVRKLKRQGKKRVEDYLKEPRTSQVPATTSTFRLNASGVRVEIARDETVGCWQVPIRTASPVQTVVPEGIRQAHSTPALPKNGQPSPSRVLDLTPPPLPQPRQQETVIDPKTLEALFDPSITREVYGEQPLDVHAQTGKVIPLRPRGLEEDPSNK